MRTRSRALVQSRRQQRGSANQVELVAEGIPIPVRGNLYPLSAADRQFYGDQASVTRRWFSRTWPGDMFNEVTIDGLVYDQEGPAVWHGAGVNSRHWEVVLQMRKPNPGGPNG
jgi:hypothetical protein